MSCLSGKYTETLHLNRQARDTKADQGRYPSRSLACHVKKQGGSWYVKPQMYDILFLLDHAYTFNTEILAPLEVFKNRLFYRILKDFLITPVNLRYIHAI